MCAGRGRVSGGAGYRHPLPQLHFKSRGPGTRAANDNRQPAPDAVGDLALSAFRLATLSTAALAALMLGFLPSA